MNRRKLLSLRGATLIGLGLLVVGLTALLVLSPDFVLGKKPTKPGKPEPAFYRIFMTPIGTMDTMATDTGCNGKGYVLAEWDDAHNFLRANGTMIDGVRIPLLIQLFTDVEWTRKYPEEHSGIFDGCYGETGYYHGALFITFKKKRKKTYISFNWHFDYYTAPDVREHFSLFSEDISFPAWTGDDIISEPVTGGFDLHYYLNDPEEFIGYDSITGGLGRDFDFYITIEKIAQ